jgi:hypothetical protein
MNPNVISDIIKDFVFDFAINKKANIHEQILKKSPININGR